MKIKILRILSILFIVFASVQVYSTSFHAKKNNVTLSDKCKKCNGSGSCSSCLGEGKVVCSKCDGKGKGEEINLNNGYGSHDVITCPDCNGKGSSKCRPCNASGKCNNCKGTGKSPS